MQVDGEQIRINAQLIDTRTDEHLRAETYDRDLSATSIFEVQNDIARSITEAMNATLTEQDQGQLSVIPTDNLAAYRAYRHAMDIRTGLREPSYVVPFMEPYIPMYDPVRGSPEWNALMAELEADRGD